MFTDYSEKDDILDLGNLIPTNEELDRVIQNMENNIFTFEDQMILWKIKMIDMIINSENIKI